MWVLPSATTASLRIAASLRPNVWSIAWQPAARWRCKAALSTGSPCIACITSTPTYPAIHTLPAMVNGGRTWAGFCAARCTVKQRCSPTTHPILSGIDSIADSPSGTGCPLLSPPSCCWLVVLPCADGRWEFRECCGAYFCAPPSASTLPGSLIR